MVRLLRDSLEDAFSSDENIECGAELSLLPSRDDDLGGSCVLLIVDY